LFLRRYPSEIAGMSLADPMAAAAITPLPAFFGWMLIPHETHGWTRNESGDRLAGC
jgi:hypothetical protein